MTFVEFTSYYDNIQRVMINPEQLIGVEGHPDYTALVFATSTQHGAVRVRVKEPFEQVLEALMHITGYREGRQFKPEPEPDLEEMLHDEHGSYPASATEPPPPPEPTLLERVELKIVEPEPPPGCPSCHHDVGYDMYSECAMCRCSDGFHMTKRAQG